MIEEAGLIAASSWVFKQAGGTELLARILGPSADELGLRLRENFVRICNMSKGMLDEASIQPEPVHPRVALPLLKSAVLEDDEGLQEMWAALLANAASPNQTEAGYASFVEVLQLLSPIEAALLSRLYRELPPHGVSHEAAPYRVSFPDDLSEFPDWGLAIQCLDRLGLVQADPFFREPGPWRAFRTYFGERFFLACHRPLRLESEGACREGVPQKDR